MLSLLQLNPKHVLQLSSLQRALYVTFFIALLWGGIEWATSAL